jgi:hypothetical protein
MAGYPHYRNSVASMNNFEPVYTAQYEVSITPPAGISDWSLTLEGITNVTGVTTNYLPETQQQKYKGATRTHAGGAVPDQATEISLSFELNLNDSNSMYTYKALRAWTDLVYDPLTGKFGLKKDYIGGPMIVSQFNKNGDIFRQITYPVVFPTTAIELPTDFDYEDAGVWKIDNFTLTADYWDETWI